MNKKDEVLYSQDEYKYGFSDKDVSIYNTGKGLTRDTVIAISKIKNEPEWMLEYRLKAYEAFEKMPIQSWGPNLDLIDFDDYTYYIRPSDKKEKSCWKKRKCF